VTGKIRKRGRKVRERKEKVWGEGRKKIKLRRRRKGETKLSNM